jgi:hypothetical protein
MSNGFIYVVDAHFIDQFEETKILDPNDAQPQGKSHVTKNSG